MSMKDIFLYKKCLQHFILPTTGDMAYWSLQRITTHRRRQENNQRAFLLPREPERWDSHAVEATSYALLVFLMREGVTTNTESIMRWLNAVRDWDFAFVSTAVSFDKFVSYCSLLV